MVGSTLTTTPAPCPHINFFVSNMLSLGLHSSDGEHIGTQVCTDPPRERLLVTIPSWLPDTQTLLRQVAAGGQGRGWIWLFLCPYRPCTGLLVKGKLNTRGIMHGGDCPSAFLPESLDPHLSWYSTALMWPFIKWHVGIWSPIFTAKNLKLTE